MRAPFVLYSKCETLFIPDTGTETSLPTSSSSNTDRSATRRPPKLRPPLQIQVVGNVVPVDIYHQVFPGSATSAPYRLALRHLFMQMARIARKTRTERVKCWFERGAVDGDAYGAHRLIKTSGLYIILRRLERLNACK